MNPIKNLSDIIRLDEYGTAILVALHEFSTEYPDMEIRTASYKPISIDIDIFGDGRAIKGTQLVLDKSVIPDDKDTILLKKQFKDNYIYNNLKTKFPNKNFANRFRESK